MGARRVLISPSIQCRASHCTINADVCHEVPLLGCGCDPRTSGSGSLEPRREGNRSKVLTWTAQLRSMSDMGIFHQSSAVSKITSVVSTPSNHAQFVGQPLSKEQASTFLLTFRIMSASGMTALRLGIAFGIGLLIGAERERRKGKGPQRAAAGIRTFTIAGALGAVCFQLGGTALIAVMILALAGFISLSYLP